jgi:hypothetical protein
MNGFVYVATGKGYVAEAVRSAASLRLAMPEAQICLVTDEPFTADDPFSQIIVKTGVRRGPIDKLFAIDAPYERIVFLDTDTLVLSDLSALFSILDRFELGVLPETKRGWHYSLPGVPQTFAEFNTGVIAFRRDDRMIAFFADWLSEFDALRASGDYAFAASDQPAFRAALWKSDVRICPIPSEFHFLGNVPNYIMWDAKLIHGRGDTQRIALDVNSRLGARTYIPDVGVIGGFHGKRDWVKQTAKTIARMTGLIIGHPMDATSSNPSKWWEIGKANVRERI